MLTNTYTTALTTEQQGLKENGYQESTICKTFKRITNNQSLSQPQQQT